MASYQYTYVMKNLVKAYPGGKKVLDGVWLNTIKGTPRLAFWGRTARASRP